MSTVKPRLMLCSSSSSYKLDKIHDVYTIECQNGDAVEYSKDLWYAISMEVDGVQTPCMKKEACHMKVFDERDPEHGAVLLMHRTTFAWKDGLFYFRALDWRQVGHYRITFKVPHPRKDYAEAGVTPLVFHVKVSDPDWEAEMLAKLEEELEVQWKKQEADREKAMEYPLAPLSKKEKEWLDKHAASLPRDPGIPALQVLASEMQAAFKTPMPKDMSVLLPLFESDASKARRLATEKQSREVWKRQKVLQTQRLILAGKTSVSSLTATQSNSMPQQPPHAKSLLATLLGSTDVPLQGKLAKTTVSSTALAYPLPTVLPNRSVRRKADKPLRLATQANFPQAREVLDKWLVATEEDERHAAEAATRAALGADAHKAVRKAQGLITDETMRLYRYDGLAAECSVVIWDKHMAARKVLMEWAGISANMVQQAVNHAADEFRAVFRGRRGSTHVGLDDRKLALLRASLNGETLGSCRSAKRPRLDVKDGSDTAADGGDAAEFPLTPSESRALLLKGLETADTTNAPGWMLLARLLKSIPCAEVTDLENAYLHAISSGYKRKRAPGSSS